MHDYLFVTDVVRFSFIIGIVVSVLLYERRHLSTGSVVVPGYIAVFGLQPLVLIATAVNALASYWLVNRLLPRWFLLYGRTKFVVLALVSILLQTLLLQLSPSGPYLWEADAPIFVGVGYVVPALIAHDMGRQGIKNTFKAVALAGLLVAVPLAVAVWLAAPAGTELAPFVGYEVMAMSPEWVPLAVLLSGGAAWGLTHNHGFRSGGFIGAAYLALLSRDFLQVAFVVGLSLLTWLLVTRFLMPRMVLFGRRKFATMLLVSASIAWTLTSLAHAVTGVEVSHYMTLSSVALVPLFVPALVANDMERSGLVPVLAGLGLGTAFVYLAATTVEVAVASGVVPVLRCIGALAVAAVIFRYQFDAVGRWALGGVARLVLGRGGRHARHPHTNPQPV